ncbi:MAG: hypothetical protein UH824_03980 [Acutalibacteraceae bacterium]|nr:hypothetical protein [Acutalibacteraceae bacterium]
MIFSKAATSFLRRFFLKSPLMPLLLWLHNAGKAALFRARGEQALQFKSKIKTPLTGCFYFGYKRNF